jgi:Zn-dependent hydrolases, including glyoxylases
MSVNAYMIWDDTSLHAALFDTGTDFNAIRKAVDENGLTLRFVCLTHTHGDHTAVLEQVRSSFSPVVLCSPAEPVPGGQAVREGDVVEMESLSIAVLETDGHSPGGLTFHVTGFRGAPGAAATGDALFAGSVGGGARVLRPPARQRPRKDPDAPGRYAASARTRPDDDRSRWRRRTIRSRV